MAPSQKYLLAASLLLMMSALTWWSSVSIRQAEQLAATVSVTSPQFASESAAVRQEAETKIISSLSSLVGLIGQRLGVISPAPQTQSQPAVAPPASPASGPTENAVPGEYFIKYTKALETEVGSQDKEALVAAVETEINAALPPEKKVQVTRVFPSFDMAFVKVPDEDDAFRFFEDRVNELGRAGRLNPFTAHRKRLDEPLPYWAPNRIYQLAHHSPNHYFVWPNDPYFFFPSWPLGEFYSQWYMWEAIWTRGISATTGWALEAGFSEPWAVVAMMDTTVLIEHPELQNQWWTNPGEAEGYPNNIDDDQNGVVDDYYGYNACLQNGRVEASESSIRHEPHGTEVAGLIGALGNNRIGIAGTAWGLKILPLVTSECFRGSPALTYADALEYFGDLPPRPDGTRQARVINMSFSTPAGLGGEVICELLQEFFPDVLAVMSAGNRGLNLDAPGTVPYYPSACDVPNKIVVAASVPAGYPGEDVRGGLWRDSNYGPNSVDLAAPGRKILTTSFSVFGGNPTYKLVSGTSSAAPLVAGVAGLLLSGRPNFEISALKRFILQNTTQWNDLRNLVGTGGILNACRALWESGARGDPPAPDNPCIFTYPQELPEETPETG